MPITRNESEGSIEPAIESLEEVSAPEEIHAELQEVVPFTDNDQDNQENQEVSIPIDEDTGKYQFHKGQIISKAIFVFLISPKKRTKKI